LLEIAIIISCYILKNGDSVLAVAVYWGRYDIIKYLLEEGASIYTRNEVNSF
jgi:ankyrin repeat protein